MYKRVLLSSAAFAALTVTGSAADLPARGVAPAPYYAAAPIFSWTGFYIGVNAGGVFNSNDNGTQAFSGATPAFAAAGFAAGGQTPTAPGAIVTNLNAVRSNNNGNSGFAGGGEIGYNHQIGQLVLGIEADIQGIARSNRNNNNGFSTIGDVTGGAASVANYHVFGPTTNERANWFGTVRGRIGYAFDRVLVFGTGGFAYTGNNCNNGFNAGAGCGTQASYINYYAAGSTTPVVFTNASVVGANNSNNNIGYAVGGGFEYAFTNNLSAKLEYLYVNLNRRNNNGYNPNGVYTNAQTGATLTGVGGVAGVYSGNNRNNGLNVIRVGLNYKFGALSSAPAVVAKY